MRRIGVVICIALVTACCSTASAQNMAELSFGLSIPNGDLNDLWDSSLMLNGGVFLETSPFTMLGFSFGLNRFGLDEESYHLPDDCTISGGDLSVISLCAEGRVKTGSMEKAVFYAGAGGGLYSVGTSDLTIDCPNDRVTTTFDRKNKVGGFIGGGAGYPITTQIKAGAKVQYHVFSVGDDHGFEDLGDTRSFFSLQFLVMIFI